MSSNTSNQTSQSQAPAETPAVAPELTVEQRRNLITSIRPNGKIRPIPAGSTAEISYENIRPGENMINFHNEYGHGRYYRKENFEKIMNEKAQNPYTRARINTYYPYIASINGNTAGKNFHDTLNVGFDIDEDDYYAPRIHLYKRTSLTNGDNIFIQQNDEPEGYTDNTPFKEIVSTFVELLSAPSNSINLEYAINFFGIRDSENTFFVEPTKYFTVDNQRIYNLNIPLSSIIGQNNYLMLEPSLMMSPYESIQLQIPNDLFQSSQERMRFDPQWKRIQTSIYNDVIPSFKIWLNENPERLENFLKQNLTPEYLSFVDTMKKELNDLARSETIKWLENYRKKEREQRKRLHEAQKKSAKEKNAFNQKYEKYYTRFDGGLRKTRRLNSRSKKRTRKN
jgi:hypothetical protein